MAISGCVSNAVSIGHCLVQISLTLHDGFLFILYCNIHYNIPQTDALKMLVFKHDSSLQLLNMLA